MNSDPVLLKLSLSRPHLEMFLSADGVLTKIVFMSEMLCSKKPSRIWCMLLIQVQACKADAQDMLCYANNLSG